MIEARDWAPKRSSRAGIVALALLVTALAVTAALIQVWTHLQAIEYGYKLSKATKENTRLKELNRQLRLEEALLKNPERIAHIAKTELGMAPPQPEQVRRLQLRPLDQSSEAAASTVARADP